MKKVVVYTCAVIILLTGIGIAVRRYWNSGQDKISELPAVGNIPVLKFVKSKYDFGTVKKEDSPFNVVFEFKNEGNMPLIIQKVDVSCGCLSAEYPKQPTIPDEKGSIKVKIDAKDFTGAFNKTLFVKSNAAEDVILLRITGQIK